MSQASVLTLENVSKKYGDFTAVDSISLNIPQGCIYGFLGPNGAGKTTTLRMILDIIKPTSGRVSILGSSSAIAVRNRLGYLPEEKGLYKKMKVLEVVAYFAMLKGMERSAARLQAQSLLEKYGLQDYAQAKVESLSKGMGQKVQVLATVAHEPDLVILDEPFSGLDPVNQQVLEELIKSMATAGRTVIFSTHVMAHAERLCDYILLIAKGRKIFDGTVAQAKALIPRRVLIETENNIQALSNNLNGIFPVEVDQTSDALKRWTMEIPEQSSPQEILKKCFELGISLNRFEYSEPSLHDVFVHLVGNDAREHRLR